jgi:hypothetical protein
MNKSNGLLVLISFVCTGLSLLSGCAEQTPQYGVERQLGWQNRQHEVWAVAPAINLSGYGSVDPLLQADLLYAQLQQVRGLTVIPVNRVAETYATLKIDKVQSEQQAALVCELLGADRLIVPTITAYDPYVPPKVGASLQVLNRPKDWVRPASVDPRELARQAAPNEGDALPSGPQFIQAVGMFDAANGSVRDALYRYAAGRNDPVGPMGPKEYLASMDRYCGFVYHELIEQVIARAASGKR